MGEQFELEDMVSLCMLLHVASKCESLTWCRDFICLDEQKQAVAKFSCKIWGMKNIANIEFVGDLAHDKAAREEIAIVGMTLMYCMAVRTSSLASLFGALFARPGPIEDKKKE